MNADSSGPTPVRKWTWMRWTGAVAIVFLVHVVLIFIFGARKPLPPTPPSKAPSLALVAESPGDWLALNNATLFALPGNYGFAASMWMQMPPLTIHPQNWTEDPRWLSPSNSLQMAGLFAAFNRFVQTNTFAALQFQFNPPDEVTPPVTPTQPPMAQHSTLRIEGEIAGRTLLTPLHLPSWPDSDVDAPSIVQVLINAAGNVVSAVLLPQEIVSQENSWEPPLSHNPKADLSAVELARTLRFAPLPSAQASRSAPLSGLALGKLVFIWHTIPITTTNVLY
ncbi:MAG: hypothetical protein ACREFR_05060 [Limisphaerales bacterium]